MTTASILTIGDELLIGQVIDTNSAWIATRLNDEGFRVVHKQTVGDDEADILRALGEAQARTDIVLVTGGLGPTKDDITLHALCQHFHTTLHFSEAVYAHIAHMFARRGKGKIVLKTEVFSEGELAAVFTGTFVALKS